MKHFLATCAYASFLLLLTGSSMNCLTRSALDIGKYRHSNKNEQNPLFITGFGFARELNQREFSPDFRSEFHERGIALPDALKVKVVSRNRWWQLSDTRGKLYSVWSSFHNSRQILRIHLDEDYEKRKFWAYPLIAGALPLAFMADVISLPFQVLFAPEPEDDSIVKELEI